MQGAAVISIGTSVPPYSYTQDEVFAKAGYQRQIIQKIFRNSAIERRYLAVEPGDTAVTDPKWFAHHYETWAPRLAAEAGRKAMLGAGCVASDIDYVVATSCTGYLCPGISQRVARDLGLGPRAKNANLAGMGCNAMVPALERATEFAERHPGANVLCVATEICSATYWIDDRDLESAVGNAIFADGASAAIVRAGEAASPSAPLVRFKKFASRSNREMLGYMGFQNEAGRLRVQLSRNVPQAVLPLAEEVLGDLLGERKLSPADISHWIVHPGGRLILELLGERLRLGDRLEASWQILAGYGNMSSATILFVLENYLSKNQAKIKPGDVAIMLAMGPGLSVEGALLEF